MTDGGQSWPASSLPRSTRASRLDASRARRASFFSVRSSRPPQPRPPAHLRSHDHLMSMPSPPLLLRTPPGVWSPAQRALQKVAGPIERFLHVEAASGILLLTAALVALVW